MGFEWLSLPPKKHRHESWRLDGFIHAGLVEEGFEHCARFGVAAFFECEAVKQFDIRAVRASFESLVFEVRHRPLRPAFRAGFTGALHPSEFLVEKFFGRIEGVFIAIVVTRGKHLILDFSHSFEMTI